MWIEENNSLVRHFVFSNFAEAFAFLNQIAEITEKHQHHAEITNVYNRVSLRFNTHDAGNIVTDKDRIITAEIDLLLF